jgi:7-cyano-7-deazaguanine synthase in queuosine biosynthesis
MIINTSQGNLEFNLPENFKNVGIRLSGGCDSAIIGYLLGKYVKEERPDISLVAISLDVQGKDYQINIAKKVMNFIENEFDIKFKNHFTGLIEDQRISGKMQADLCSRLLANNEIDCYFTGLTRNPPDEEMRKFAVDIFDIPAAESAIHRSHDGTKLTVDGNRYFPLINIDKKGVAELYQQFDLLDRLFPLTKSCENFSPESMAAISVHCETLCWQCCERGWGFGRFI